MTRGLHADYIAAAPFAAFRARSRSCCTDRDPPANRGRTSRPDVAHDCPVKSPRAPRGQGKSGRPPMTRSNKIVLAALTMLAAAAPLSAMAAPPKAKSHAQKTHEEYATGAIASVSARGAETLRWPDLQACAGRAVIELQGRRQGERALHLQGWRPHGRQDHGGEELAQLFQELPRGSNYGRGPRPRLFFCLLARPCARS